MRDDRAAAGAAAMGRLGHDLYVGEEEEEEDERAHTRAHTEAAMIEMR